MATDIRTSSLKSPVDVGEYLFRRLHEMGVRSIHGVPGDYNLVRPVILLQGVYSRSRSRWTTFPRRA